MENNVEEFFQEKLSKGVILNKKEQRHHISRIEGMMECDDQSDS